MCPNKIEKSDQYVKNLITCEERGTPYWLVGAGRLVCPEWKVDLQCTKFKLKTVALCTQQMINNG